MQIVPTDAPRVSSHRHHVNTIIGSNAELHCSYNSSTPATIKWIRPDKALSVSDQPKYLVNNEPRGTTEFRSSLVINNVQNSDLGEYLCEVHNPIGRVHLKLKLALTPEPPKFVRANINPEEVITHWSIRSHQPLSEVKLNYRQNGVGLTLRHLEG